MCSANANYFMIKFANAKKHLLPLCNCVDLGKIKLRFVFLNFCTSTTDLQKVVQYQWSSRYWGQLLS